MKFYFLPLNIRNFVFCSPIFEILFIPLFSFFLSLRLLLGCLHGCQSTVLVVAYLGRTLRCESRSCFSVALRGRTLDCTFRLRVLAVFSITHLGHSLDRASRPHVSAIFSTARIGRALGHASQPRILVVLLGRASRPYSGPRVFAMLMITRL